MTNSVSTVDAHRPEMTAIAIGARKRALSPMPSERGKSTRIVVKLVIAMGRSRVCALPRRRHAVRRRACAVD